MQDLRSNSTPKAYAESSKYDELDGIVSAQKSFYQGLGVQEGMGAHDVGAGAEPDQRVGVPARGIHGATACCATEHCGWCAGRAVRRCHVKF